MAAKKKAKTPGKKANGKSKTAKVIALLQRPNGVTREQVLSMIDWQAISFQQVAKAAGVKLKLEKVAGKPTVYRAV